ncbi:uncharacterized protein BCR38DRAFT_179699 [Pseudomassariella vexata]|uniref:Uncharacterized protein n=1 Tax=Pseudomassariella vexata TaxID=1141098 RepID=A0A1Y2E4C9_9PEZI|nr:uncharacterized protein BCR38DRAFT_179699 [Pseudomassariella vexata]ORY66418.1 hypothetical protein BCR38DRAFT_179699 [Pseudomassariella vexata]
MLAFLSSPLGLAGQAVLAGFSTPAGDTTWVGLLRALTLTLPHLLYMSALMEWPSLSISSSPFLVFNCHLRIQGVLLFLEKSRRVWMSTRICSSTCSPSRMQYRLSRINYFGSRVDPTKLKSKDSQHIVDTARRRSGFQFQFPRILPSRFG